MSVVDRAHITEMIAKRRSVVVELGCGDRKRVANAIGIDRIAYPDVDLVGDIAAVMAQFPTESVDRITSHHVLEHVDDLDVVMDEAGRILKPGGRFQATVPHFSNAYFYSDPTHRRAFGLYTFCYYADSTLFRRTVPAYRQRHRFQLMDVRLEFKAARPFYLRYAVRRAVGPIVNLNRAMQELYEDSFCWLFPCYEIHYDLVRTD